LLFYSVNWSMERLKFVSNMNSRLKDERVYKDSENCYNIRMDHRETVRGCGLDASGSGYGPVNTVMNLRIL